MRVKLTIIVPALTLSNRTAAVAERITVVTGRAGAHGVMIYHRATSVRGAHTGTRVPTLLLYASEFRRALGIYRTLRTTIRRQTDVILGTRTRGTLAAHVTLGVWSARRRLARIRRRWSRLRCKRERKIIIRIALGTFTFCSLFNFVVTRSVVRKLFRSRTNRQMYINENSTLRY